MAAQGIRMRGWRGNWTNGYMKGESRNCLGVVYGLVGLRIARMYACITSDEDMADGAGVLGEESFVHRLMSMRLC